MKLRTSYTVNGNVVEPIGCVGEYDVYKDEGIDQEDVVILYFVDKEYNIIKKLHIESGMGHASSFICAYSLEDMT